MTHTLDAAVFTVDVDETRTTEHAAWLDDCTVTTADDAESALDRLDDDVEARVPDLRRYTVRPTQTRLP